MAAERQAEASILTGKAGAARLWATWLIGPVAWAVHETGTYWLSTWMCSNGVLWLFHAATLVALMAAAAGAALAWRLLRYADAPPPDHLTRTTERIRFQALGGIIISVVSVVGIALEGIPNFVLDPCIGIP